MAMTNKQLAERARDLGRHLERDVDTSGLNKEQLTALVSALEEESGIDAEGEETSSEDEEPEESTQQESTSQGSPPLEQAKPKKRAPRKKKASHYVAKGRAVQSPRGQLRELEDVQDTDFEPEVLDLLIKKGCVKKRG